MPQISRRFFLKQPQELLEESQLPGLSGPILKNKMFPPPKVTQGRRLSAAWKRYDRVKSYEGSWVIPEPPMTQTLSPQRASGWRAVT